MCFSQKLVKRLTFAPRLVRGRTEHCTGCRTTYREKQKKQGFGKGVWTLKDHEIKRFKQSLPRCPRD